MYLMYQKYSFISCYFTLLLFHNFLVLTLCVYKISYNPIIWHSCFSGHFFILCSATINIFWGKYFHFSIITNFQLIKIVRLLD